MAINLATKYEGKIAEKFTKEVCDYIGIEPGNINHIKFKNDNNFVQILETVRDYDVYLIQSAYIGYKHLRLDSS